MGQQGRSQFDIVNALGVLVPSWRSHRNRVKKQALFRDLSGNGYVVTLTCFAASIDVGIDAKCKDLFTNTTTVPCTVEHDSEECLQSECCFLLVPVVLIVRLPIASKEGVWSSRSLTSPNSFTPEDIINWDPTSIVAHQALLLRSFSNLMSQNAVQCCADFIFILSQLVVVAERIVHAKLNTVVVLVVVEVASGVGDNVQEAIQWGINPFVHPFASILLSVGREEIRNFTNISSPQTMASRITSSRSARVIGPSLTMSRPSMQNLPASSKSPTSDIKRLS